MKFDNMGYELLIIHAEKFILNRLVFVKDSPMNDDHMVVPVCKYNGQIGTNISGYNQTYCDETVFQPTFNEYGMCFTFNNRKQGMDEYFSRRNLDNTKDDNPVTEESQEQKIDFTKHNKSEVEEREILKVTKKYLELSFFKIFFKS